MLETYGKQQQQPYGDKVMMLGKKDEDVDHTDVVHHLKSALSQFVTSKFNYGD